MNITNTLKKLKSIIKAKWFRNEEKLAETNWYEARLGICGICPLNSANIPRHKWDTRMHAANIVNLGNPFCSICCCEIDALASLEESECSDTPPKWKEVEL